MRIDIDTLVILCAIRDTVDYSSMQSARHAFRNSTETCAQTFNGQLQPHNTIPLTYKKTTRALQCIVGGCVDMFDCVRVVLLG